MATILQNADVTINITVRINGETPASVPFVKYEIYSTGGTLMFTKESATYADGVLSINLTEAETAALPAGDYVQECAARTDSGIDFYPLYKKPLTVAKTRTRIV